MPSLSSCTGAVAAGGTGDMAGPLRSVGSLYVHVIVPRLPARPGPMPDGAARRARPPRKAVALADRLVEDGRMIASQPPAEALAWAARVVHRLERVPDMGLWDLFAFTNSHQTVETWLANYHDLGRADLTAADLRKRHTGWTMECLARHRPAAS